MADPNDPLSVLEEGLEPRNPGSAGRSPTLPPATGGMFGGEAGQAPEAPRNTGLAGFAPGQGPQVTPVNPLGMSSFPTMRDYQQHATSNRQAAIDDYDHFRQWDEFMMLPSWRRVLDYAEIANRLNPATGLPEAVSDRSRRLLAWGLQNDDEAINMLNRRGESNWFQFTNLFQSHVALDFILPGDLNAVSSGEAADIVTAWDELGPNLEAASSILTPQAIDELRDVDAYFNDQWDKASSNLVGDEQYVDMDDGDRPEWVTAYYNSGGEIFRELAEGAGWALDWLPLLTTVKLGSKMGAAAIGNIAEAGIGRGLARTGAQGVRGAAGAIRHPLQTGARAVTPAASKYSDVVKAWQATRFRTWIGKGRTGTAIDWTKRAWGGPARDVVPMLGKAPPRFTGRGIAATNVAIGSGVLAAQSAYDLFLREVPSATIAEYQRDQAALEANLQAGIASGIIVPDRLAETAQAMVERQVRQQSDWRDQRGQATYPATPEEAPSAAEPATTPTWGPLASPTGVSALGAGETPDQAPGTGFSQPTPELTAPGLTSTTPSTLQPFNPPAAWDEVSSISTYATGGASGTAAGPPPLLGGMADQWQRDANGNLLADNKGNPIPNSDPYAKQGPLTQNPLQAFGLGPGYPPMYPQYRSGDEVSAIENMSPAQIMSLTAKMRAAGYDIGPEYSFAGGRMNGALVEQFSSLLTTANWNGTTWEDQLDFETKAAAKMQRDIMDQNMTQYARYRYLAPDYDTLAQGAKAQIRDNLGRDPTQAEIELYADAFRDVDRQAQRQQYRQDRQTHRQSMYDEMAGSGVVPTRRERIDVPIEDPSTGGIDPSNPLTRPMLVDRPIKRPGGRPGSQPGGTNVDVEASMAEWFERNYGDEVDMREAMDQAAQNFTTMAQGSSALTARVRQG